MTDQLVAYAQIVDYRLNYVEPAMRTFHSVQLPALQTMSETVSTLRDNVQHLAEFQRLASQPTCYQPTVVSIPFERIADFPPPDPELTRSSNDCYTALT